MEHLPHLSRAEIIYGLTQCNHKHDERLQHYLKLIKTIFNLSSAQIEITDNTSSLSPTSLQDEMEILKNEEVETAVYDKFCSSDKNHFFTAKILLRGSQNQTLGNLLLINNTQRVFTAAEKQQLLLFSTLISEELDYQSHLHEEEEKITNEFYYDPLTQMPNRNLFVSDLNHTIEARTEKEDVIVIAIQLNHIRDLHNSISAEASEHIINEIKNRIKEKLNDAYGVAYWKEDCFVFFTRIHRENASLSEKIKAINNLFITPITDEKNKYSISIRTGVSIYGIDSDDANELLEKALYAMDINHENPNSEYQLYSDKRTQKFANQCLIELKLREAIEKEEVNLVYQPIFNLKTGEISSLETLCRWKNEELGEISPDEFIAVAEQSDLIHMLGNYVLKKACEQYNQWSIPLSHPLQLAINVSIKQLVAGNLYETLLHILEENKLNPKLIVLEVTETVFSEINTVREEMEKITDLGISFALDDFGTGYSSLSYLKLLPLRILKVDRSFIKDVKNNKNNAEITKTVIALSKILNLQSIAEGIETDEQLHFLQENQCDYVQGFLLSKPLSAESISDLLLKLKR